MKTRRFVKRLVIALVLGAMSEAALACSTAPVAIIKPKLEWRDYAYHTMVGAKVIFDLRGSYDPDAYDYIVKYKMQCYDEHSCLKYEHTECLKDCPSGARDHDFDGLIKYVFTSIGYHTILLYVTDNRGVECTSSAMCAVIVHESVSLDGSGVFGTISQGLTDWEYNKQNWVGSELWVGPGQYVENLEFNSAHNGLTLRSSNPADPAVVAETILEPVSNTGTAVRFNSGIGTDTKLAGFTITGANSSNSPYGTGILCSAGSPTVENCIIKDNYYGMYNEGDSSPVVNRCIFSHNAEGGITNGYYGGAGSVMVSNSVFYYNERWYNEGGGIYNKNYTVHLTNCTFFGNFAYYYGGAIYNTNTGVVNAKNCIFYANTAGYEPEEIYNESGTVTVSYSDVDDYKCYNVTRENCINSDPKFVNEDDAVGPDDIWGTLDDGLRIRPGLSTGGGGGSPCIDAGDPGTTTQQAGVTDLWGNPRLRDGDYGTDPLQIDMGACEVPSVWFVDDVVSNSTGKSWQTPFNTFQGVDGAFAKSRAGDEIWVAKGTYKPGATRASTFQLPEGRALYGGFPEAASNPSWVQRDWNANLSTLSGNIDSGGGNDAYHVVKGANGAILDGFVISGGYANGTGIDQRGGGMYNGGCWPEVRNCKFTANYASSGGGMANCGGSKTVVKGCIFEGYPEDYSAYFGGGMFNDGSAPEVSNSVFSGNKAVWGGGMYNVGVGADPLITNCVFAGNKAPLGGAGMMNYSGAAEFNNVPVLVNCTFSRNHHPADIGPEQAMYNFFSAPTVTNCIIWGDEDDTGGLIEGTAIVTFMRADASFRHCDIEHSRDEQDNWYDANGRDGGGNIDQTPVFRDETQPAGVAGNIWMTADDGLRLKNTSPCIDRADGDFAPEKDILGRRRFDEPSVIGGVGQPDYVDIGAYEYFGRRISGGEFHTLLTDLEGTLMACGGNIYKQLGIGDVPGPKLTPVQVKGENGVGYLSYIWCTDAGFYHSLAVSGSEGYVFAWGMNSAGQIGNGSDFWTVQPTPVKVSDGEMETTTNYLQDIVKVSAGRSGEYSLACDRTENRNAWAWGLNYTGQLGNNDSEHKSQKTPVRVVKVDNTPLTGIVDVDAGIHHSIGLDASGCVWTWGCNSRGQLGDGTTTQRDYAVNVVGLGGAEYLTNITDVAVTCGLSEFLLGSSYALEDAPSVDDGYVWAWGDNSEGQLGRGPSGPTHSLTPLQVLKGGQQVEGDYLRDIVAISAGNFHVLALDKNGNVWAWGRNISGQLGQGNFLPNDTKAPVRVKKSANEPLTNIILIDAGFEHSLAVDVEDNVWVWGENSSGQLGLGYNWPDREPYAKEMP